MLKPLAARSILVRRFLEAGALVTLMGLFENQGLSVERQNQWLNGMHCLIRYSSVEWTPVVPRRERRRLGFLVWSKCRLPARERSTFPLAVILNRFAADFLVLMPLGRRINSMALRPRNP